MLTFRFSGVDGAMTVSEILTSGMVGKQVKFELSPEWKDLRKTVVYMAGREVRISTDVGEVDTIPAEVLAKPADRLYVGIYGVSPDGKLVIPTIRADGPEIKPGACPAGDPTANPDLAVWAQILNLIGDTDSLATEEKGSLVAAINETVEKSADSAVVNVDLTGYATESWVQEGFQPKGDYALNSAVPTMTSQLANDSGFITDCVETDPTVPDWAKQAEKPAYTAAEVGALPDTTEIPVVPAKVSAFENDAGYLTEHQDISGKLDASELPTAINTALEQAKASGEFDGAPGQDGTSVTHSWNGTTLTVSSASGTSAADLKGPQGPAGGLVDYDKNVKAIAHRGYSIGAPENTIPAYIKAREMGFTYAECDVCFTSDGVAVLLHDETIDRTSDGTGNISEMTYAQAMQYDFGSWFSEDYAGTKIATFEEFILLCRNIGLRPYIELKENGTYTQEQIVSIVNAVKAAGMKGKVTYISFNIDYLGYVKAAEPKARLGYLHDISDTTLAELLALRTDTNEIFFNVYQGNLTDEDVQVCFDNDIPLEVWMTNTAEKILNYNPYVSGVTSDSLIAGQILYEAHCSYVAPETPEVPEEPTYTNLVPTSIDSSGAVFNGTGYQNGVRLNSSGVTKEAINATTGFIAAKGGDVVRISGCSWAEAPEEYTSQGTANNYLCAYDSSFTFIGGVIPGDTDGGYTYGTEIYSLVSGDSTLTTITLAELETIAYIRVCCRDYDETVAADVDLGAEMIVTVNEEIT